MRYENNVSLYEKGQLKIDSLEYKIELSKESDSILKEYIISINENIGCNIDSFPEILNYDRTICKSFRNFKKTKVIYVRISLFNCWSCVREIAKILEKECEKLSLDYCFIIENKELEMVKFLMDYAEINLEKVFLISKPLLRSLDNKENMYMFTIKNSHLNKIFIPIKGDSLVLKQFIKTIKKVYKFSTIWERKQRFY